jgi:uncharacterized protein (TIGR03067 family)
MRTGILVLMVLGNMTSVRSGTAYGGSDDGGSAGRMARLVRELGDRSFARREAASRALAAIGEPARAALIKATTDPDPEVARRARAALDGLTARAQAAAAKTELDRWQGEWTGNGGQRLVFRGDRWMWGDGGPSVFDEGTARRVVIVAVGEKVVQADLVVGDPAEGGRVCRAIFRLDGDTLNYCGTYDPDRPTEFRHTATNVFVRWKRAKK